MSEVVSQLLSVLVVSAAFLSLVAVAEYLSRRFQPSPESTRKLVHLGGGLICLVFPFLFTSHWLVLCLACAMALFFGIGERLELLSCLTRVARSSNGSQYYPLAVWAVFYLSQGKPWLFVSSLLVLAVADAGAALVGSRYGSMFYTVEFERKSIEGSVFFFLLAFLAVQLPLLLFGPTTPLIAILASVLVATMVTVIEAISRSGRDNIFIPLAVCLILQRIVEKPAFEVWYQLVSILGLSVGLGTLFWHSKRYNFGGAAACILFVYAAWSLGSELWALPILASQLLLLRVGRRETPAELIRVSAVVDNAKIPLALLFAANWFGVYTFFYGPYVLAVFLCALLEHRMRDMPLSWKQVLVLWFVSLLLPWFLQANGAVLLLLPGVLVIAMGRVSAQAAKKLRTGLVLTAVCSLMVLQFFGFPLWLPTTESIALLLYR